MKDLVPLWGESTPAARLDALHNAMNQHAEELDATIVELRKLVVANHSMIYAFETSLSALEKEVADLKSFVDRHVPTRKEVNPNAQDRETGPDRAATS